MTSSYHPLRRGSGRAPEGPWGCRQAIYHTPDSDAARAAVERVQRVLGGEPNGELDERTRQLIRGFQHLVGIPVTGIIDKALAEAIDQVFPHGALEDAAN